MFMSWLSRIEEQLSYEMVGLLLLYVGVTIEVVKLFRDSFYDFVFKIVEFLPSFFMLQVQKVTWFKKKKLPLILHC